MKEAFQWLKENNPLYSDILEREAWEQACLEEDHDVWTELTSNEHTEVENMDAVVSEEELDPSETQEKRENSEEVSDDGSAEEDTVSKLRGIKLDSCIQPDDPTIEATNRVVSIAPGEGKRPMNILTDEKFEALAFPTLFSSGKFGMGYPRPVSISAKKYFQRRILEHGSQFASNIEYMFVGQFVSEWQQIRNSMSVALRKSFGAEESGDIYTAAAFKNPDRIRPLLMKHCTSRRNHLKSTSTIIMSIF